VTGEELSSTATANPELGSRPNVSGAHSNTIPLIRVNSESLDDPFVDSEAETEIGTDTGNVTDMLVSNSSYLNDPNGSSYATASARYLRNTPVSDWQQMVLSGGMTYLQSLRVISLFWEKAYPGRDDSASDSHWSDKFGDFVKLATVSKAKRRMEMAMMTTETITISLMLMLVLMGRSQTVSMNTLR
jgi:hypothetical protein